MCSRAHPARAEPCPKHAQQALLPSEPQCSGCIAPVTLASQDRKTFIRATRRTLVPKPIARLMREFYGCYLLQSQGEKCKGRTYIG